MDAVAHQSWCAACGQPMEAGFATMDRCRCASPVMTSEPQRGQAVPAVQVDLTPVPPRHPNARCSVDDVYQHTMGEMARAVTMQLDRDMMLSVASTKSTVMQVPGAMYRKGDTIKIGGRTMVVREIERGFPFSRIIADDPMGGKVAIPTMRPPLPRMFA